MRKYQKITPEGTRDLLFEECEAKRRAERMLSGLFARRGFREVMTPAVEFYDVFSGLESGLPQEEIHKLVDGKGRLLALRPDCTVPIARLVSTRLQGCTLPLRLFYMQNVYRLRPSLSGHRDEMTQAGIEFIGASGRRADLEVLVTALETLQCLEIPDFMLEIGHAGFFGALSAALPLDEEGCEHVRMLIEGKNYAALGDLLDTLEDSPVVRAVRALPRLFGGAEVFEQAAALCGDIVREPLDYLRSIYNDLCKFGLNGRIMVDLGLVHQNDYYTGVIFRGYLPNSGEEILSGGRYDGLLSGFGHPLPATGFGINVDALVTAMMSRGDMASSTPVQVLIHGDDGFEMQALARAGELISEGIVCEVSVFETREEAVNYARGKRIARVDVIGQSVETIEPGEGETP